MADSSVHKHASPEPVNRDHRAQSYAFTTARDLTAFFLGSLPKKLIKDTIKEVRAGFVPRTESTKDETDLQILKRCEVKLVELAKRQLRT